MKQNAGSVLKTERFLWRVHRKSRDIFWGLWQLNPVSSFCFVNIVYYIVHTVTRSNCPGPENEKEKKEA